jgi:large conductance mechanosensitive channel
VAFGLVIKSLVADILMPPIGILLGNVDFSNLFIVIKEGTTAGPFDTLAAAKEAGAVVISYGVFFNTIISFIIVAFAVFMLIRSLNKMKKKEEAPAAEPTTKECTYCFSTIPIKATKCPQCASSLGS